MNSKLIKEENSKYIFKVLFWNWMEESCYEKYVKNVWYHIGILNFMAQVLVTNSADKLLCPVLVHIQTNY